MSGTESFFDTNVVLYLFSSDSAKADRAEELLAAGGVVSVQVLNELASVARRKLNMKWQEVREIVAQIRAICRVESLTIETYVSGIEIAERYNLSVYDAMILASARDAGCATVYTEDMQDKQVIDDRLIIRNPFVMR